MSVTSSPTYLVNKSARQRKEILDVEMTLSSMEEDITKAVEMLSNTVVSIESRIYARGFRFGRRAIPLEGAGSGVLFDSAGHVITNNHVVESADTVQVILKDGNILSGNVIGSDDATDIAVIEIENQGNLPFAKLGDSEKIRVGQLALAIGNSLGLPGGQTVSLGVVSALNRSLPGADFIYEGFIQTDAAVNPGNSGGPLANLQGEVIGINTAIIPYANGMGFAIPINMVRNVVEQILEKGRVVRPWLGISAIDLNKPLSKRFGLSVERGVMIAGISRLSPAEEAGLREGDVLLRVNGNELNTAKDLVTWFSKIGVGSEARLTFLRSGWERETSLRLVEMPTRLQSRQ